MEGLLSMGLPRLVLYNLVSSRLPDIYCRKVKERVSNKIKISQALTSQVALGN